MKKSAKYLVKKLILNKLLLILNLEEIKTGLWMLVVFTI